MAKVNPRCRIGKVTLKGGTPLRVFRSRNELQSDLVKKEFFRQANGIADAYPNDMGGYLIMGWGFDGAWLCNLHSEPGCIVSTRALPAWLPELVRAKIAADDLRRELGWDSTNG